MPVWTVLQPTKGYQLMQEWWNVQVSGCPVLTVLAVVNEGQRGQQMTIQWLRAGIGSRPHSPTHLHPNQICFSEIPNTENRQCPKKENDPLYVNKKGRNFFFSKITVNRGDIKNKTLVRNTWDNFLAWQCRKVSGDLRQVSYKNKLSEAYVS